MPIERREPQARQVQAAVDDVTLSSLIFIKKKTNPIKFLREFERCFVGMVPDQTRTVRLQEFVPRVDRFLFSEIWRLDEAILYGRFKKQFISVYLPGHIEYRRLAIAYKFSEEPSVEVFVQTKMKTYLELDGCNADQAVERAFFDLPANLAVKFFDTHFVLTKENLIDFAKYLDAFARATYDSANEEAKDVSSDESEDDNRSTFSSDLPETSESENEPYEAFYDLPAMIQARRRTAQPRNDEQVSEQPDAPQQALTSAAPAASTAAGPAKRGRGRPRKHPVKAAAPAKASKPPTKKRKK